MIADAWVLPGHRKDAPRTATTAEVAAMCRTAGIMPPRETVGRSLTNGVGAQRILLAGACRLVHVTAGVHRGR